MHYEFTPAVERALAIAALWSSQSGPGPLDLPEVLLGLASEPECRGAQLLAVKGISIGQITDRWPALARLAVAAPARGQQFSPALIASLRTAQERLWEYPQPLALATEHLLLGIVSGQGEASDWLRQRGFDAEALEAEIHRLSGHQPGPLPFEQSEAENELPAEPLARRPAPSASTSNSLSPQESRDAPLGVLRIIDAAANRAAEGLRVIEDYVRFGLDDRHLTQRCKAARHGLTSALVMFPTAQRQAARESQQDVGANVTVPTEQARTNPAAVLTASFARVEQALRSLEEYSKLSQPAAARQFEQLRYETYTLQRAVGITCTSLERLAAAKLHVLLDAGRSVEEFRGLATSLVEAGVPMLQLRVKGFPDRELLARARTLREVTRGTSTLFIMNDRPDLAALSHADGVHVGQEELTVKDARAIIGAAALVGVSTHSLQQARQAVLDGANYIGVGPTFPSGTKRFDNFPGVELVRQVSAEIRLPAFVIGGITRENLPQVLAAGGTRVAVSGAITLAENPAAAAAEFLAMLRANRREND